MSEIDFYFSIGSTYTYLSVTRILDVEKQHQVKFNWKPFSVRAIMKEMNNIPFPKDKMNKVNYMWRDIERRAENYGFFAKTPVPYPLSEFDLANQIASAHRVGSCLSHIVECAVSHLLVHIELPGFPIEMQ